MEDQVVVPEQPRFGAVKKYRAFFITLGVVLVFGLIVAFCTRYAPARLSLVLFFSHATLPAELAHASFVAEDGAVSVIYPELARTETISGKLVSATADGTRIVESNDGTFAVIVDGKELFADRRPRVGIARSPDGSKVAFAEANDPATFVAPGDAPSLALDRKAWTVVIYDSATRTRFTLGTGASPIFIDATHLAWLAPAGLVRTDLTTGSSTVLVHDSNARVPIVALVSPDHMTMGWYSAGTRAVSLYRFGTVDAPLATTTLPARTLSAALGNDGLYTLGISGNSTVISKQPFGGAPSTLFSMSSFLGIRRLLLGTI